MNKLHVAILFGGISAEHEVSVISGLQVAENIDRDRYTPHVIYVSQGGEFKYFSSVESRSDFKSRESVLVGFGRDKHGAYIRPDKKFANKIYIDAAYLAFHGGNGESGQIQGLMESLEIPYTSSTVEGSSIMMNKELTKILLKSAGITVIPGISVRSSQISQDVNAVSKIIKSKISLPVIVKPAHLGSSIGIGIARTLIELQKALVAASMVDDEIVVEELQKNFVEYNCSVRMNNGSVETSEVERPVSHDEILSFADKYQRGGNKKVGAGMASLNRELPAKISKELRDKIQSTALMVYQVCRAKGLIRVDFMKVGTKLYVTEVNPIPGSMSYYLWEAKGIPFREQISQLIEEACRYESDRRKKKLVYETDIVEKFVNSKRQ